MVSKLADIDHPKPVPYGIALKFCDHVFCGVILQSFSIWLPLTLRRHVWRRRFTTALIWLLTRQHTARNCHPMPPMSFAPDVQSFQCRVPYGRLLRIYINLTIFADMSS